MQELNTISSSQYATEQATAINQNFAALKTAVENIDGGGGGGGTAELIRTYRNRLPSQWRTDSGRTTLKVLMVGNSFSFYPVDALPNIITLSGTTKTYCLQVQGITGGAGNTLQLGVNRVYNNTTGNWAKTFGTGGTSSNAYKTAFTHDWDAIIFHQRSDDAADYDTYFPYLNALVDAARRYCTNPEVKIGWQMIWDKFHGQAQPQRDAIVLNSKRVMDDCGIDFIVPTGTAVENAWASSLSIPTVQIGMAPGLDSSGHVRNILEWVGAATFYQVLFSAFFGKDVVDDCVPTSAQSWSEYLPGSTVSNKSAADCILASKCAKAAVEDMWNITTGIS